MKKLGLILVLVMLLVGCGKPADGAGGTNMNVDFDPLYTPTPTVEPTATDVPEPTRYPTVAPRDPRISDFEIELIVIREKCFGSAGCNVTVRPDLMVGPAHLTGEWLLIYEIHGVDGGTQTCSLELHLDTGQYSFDEERLSTPKGSDTLTVEIVRILSN